MKIKNLAFYGVMAAILGSVGTARADGAADSTIIASKGYVDAYAQKQSDRVEATWAASTADHGSPTKYPSMATLNDALTTVEGNIQSVNTNALAAPEADDPKLTKVSAIKAAATTSVRDTTNAADTLLPTEKAVATALALKEDVANKQASQELGANETVTRWDTTAAEGTDAYTSDTMYPTVKAVAQQIAASNPESVNSNALAQADGNNSKLTQVAAIKDMVTTSGVDPNNDNVNNNHRNNNLNAVDYASDQKVPSEKAVAEELALKYPSAQTTPVLDSDDGATSFEAVNNGYSVGVNLGRLDALKENKSNKQAAQNGSTVTAWSTTETNQASDAYTSDTKYPTVKAVAQQIKAVADNTVAPHGITGFTASTDHSIVTYNADGLVTGGISLPGLNDINAASGGSSGCDANNPCVLSFYVANGNTYYKWTKMDIEGLPVVNDSNS